MFQLNFIFAKKSWCGSGSGGSGLNNSLDPDSARYLDPDQNTAPTYEVDAPPPLNFPILDQNTAPTYEVDAPPPLNFPILDQTELLVHVKERVLCPLCHLRANGLVQQHLKKENEKKYIFETKRHMQQKKSRRPHEITSYK
jgi:hypothetical protein